MRLSICRMSKVELRSWSEFHARKKKRITLHFCAYCIQYNMFEPFQFYSIGSISFFCAFLIVQPFDLISFVPTVDSLANQERRPFCTVCVQSGLRVEPINFDQRYCTAHATTFLYFHSFAQA